MYVCMYASNEYVCMYVCMYASNEYVCMYVCMYASNEYVCMYVCMYVSSSHQLKILYHVRHHVCHCFCTSHVICISDRSVLQYVLQFLHITCDMY